MAIKMEYDAKSKKIKIEIDYDPKKKYPDSKSGKAKSVGNNGWGAPVDGAPEDVAGKLRVGINAYVMNKEPEKKEKV